MQRQFRLRSTGDFARLHQEGRAYHSRLVTLSLSANGLEHNRYGIITSKQLGKAVKRNRVRRHLREAVRLLHPHLHSGFDVVLIARRDIVGQPFWTIRDTVETLCRKAGLTEIKVESDLS
jgi:ribonuclease P protein component